GTSVKLINDIALKNTVNTDDALLEVWRRSEKPFRASTNLPNSFAVKQGTSVKLINDIGLKNTVNTDDALLALEVWRRSEKPFRASSTNEVVSGLFLSPNEVFQVFQKRSDGLDLEVLSCDDIDFLKKRIEEKEMWILPIVQDLWVSLHHSLHHSFGLICWCDDEKLKKGIQELEIC
ncbi:hypothetical protein Tco_0485128, partial [Tanacetum coccineum]